MAEHDDPHGHQVNGASEQSSSRLTRLRILSSALNISARKNLIFLEFRSIYCPWATSSG
jgi:hypothetical protein